MTKQFQPHYSDNESERYLQEMASMEEPIVYTDSEWNEYEQPISQLKKYPAPWLTPEHKEVMVLGKDFEIKPRSEFYSGAYHNICAYCNKEFDKADKLWFVCQSCCDEPFAVPISGIEEGDRQLTTQDIIHLGINFSQKEQFKLSGESYRYGVGFGYSCGYQDGLKAQVEQDAVAFADEEKELALEHKIGNWLTDQSKNMKVGERYTYSEVVSLIFQWYNANK